MRIKAPSYGFLYLSLALAALLWLSVLIGRTPWFERVDSEGELGWASYLERVAPGMERARRRAALDISLQLYTKLEEWDGVIRALRLHAEFGLPVSLPGLQELLQNQVWCFGLTADKWIRGREPARFLVYNPSDEPRQYTFHWRSRGLGKAQYDSGSGEFRALELTGDDWQQARVLMPSIPAKGNAVYRFKAEQSVSLPGEARLLGLQLAGVVPVGGG